MKTHAKQYALASQQVEEATQLTLESVMSMYNPAGQQPTHESVLDTRESLAYCLKPEFTNSAVELNSQAARFFGATALYEARRGESQQAVNGSIRLALRYAEDSVHTSAIAESTKLRRQLARLFIG